MKRILTAACMGMLVSVSFPSASSADPAKTTATKKATTKTVKDPPVVKDIEGSDRLGNFEVQDLMSNWNQPEPPPPSGKLQPAKPAGSQGAHKKAENNDNAPQTQ